MSMINRILRNAALHNIKIQQSKKDEEKIQIIENNKKGSNLDLIIISENNIKITSPNTVEAIPAGDNSQWSSRVQSTIGFKDHCELSFKVSNYYTFVCLTSNPTYPNRDIIKYPNAGLYFDQPSYGIGKLTAIYDKEKVNKNFDIWDSDDKFKIILENSEFKYYKNNNLIYTSPQDPEDLGPYYLVISFYTGSPKQKEARVSNIYFTN